MADFPLTFVKCVQGRVNCDNDPPVPVLLCYVTWEGTITASGNTITLPVTLLDGLREGYSQISTACSMAMTTTNPEYASWSTGTVAAGNYNFYKVDSSTGRLVYFRYDTSNICRGYVPTSVTGSNLMYNPIVLYVNDDTDQILPVSSQATYEALCSSKSTDYTPTWVNGVPTFIAPNAYYKSSYDEKTISASTPIAWDKTIIEPVIEPVIETDPFAPGGTTGDDESESEGGDGDFENAEVTVDPPALPSLSAITSGFIAAYMPSFSQLQALGDYLWSDLFSLDTFKKLFSDPMQAILGLSLVPVSPSTNEGNVVIGNVNTGISMPRVMQQFVTVDCGSVTLPEYWGGYLDYSPYTKVEIYLPYIGVRPLDTDEVMGRTLHVVYHVDVLSGACVCFIQCDNTIRYHYVGQCGASIPITANDWTRVVNGAVSIATALGVGVATLGAGTAAAGGVTAATMAGAGALVGGVASQVLASKPRVEHSGSLAGMGGLLGIQFPYIMIQRPRQAVPSGQNVFTGYPSFIKRTLSTVTGYTQVTAAHLTGLSCTDEEKKEIQAYLEAGVIL